MPCEFLALMVAFAPLFSKPVFQHVQVLLVGAILSPGKRPVTQALRIMGKGQDTHFQNYHRVLSCWSPAGCQAATWWSPPTAALPPWNCWRPSTRRWPW